jgi:hypothetical protein
LELIHGQLSWCYTATSPAFLSLDAELVVHTWTATQQDATCLTNTIRFRVICRVKFSTVSISITLSNIQKVG